MKRRTLAVFLIGVSAFVLSASARAALIDRGGGLIYDDALNVTWLQDANYAKTIGFDLDGKMNWERAVAWAGQLVYGGYDDWRLPAVAPINGSKFNYLYSADGSTDYGHNIAYPGRVSPPDPAGAYPGSTQNELAYMFYVNLGNLAVKTTAGDRRAGSSGTDWGLSNSSFVDGVSGDLVSFENLQNDAYWSGHEVNLRYATALFTASGFNDSDGKPSLHLAWAVRDGDVARTPGPDPDPDPLPPGSVPEPATLLLLGAALAGFRLIRGTRQ